MDTNEALDSEDGNIVADVPESDIGPWCLGLPRSGQRTLTADEKARLRRAYIRSFASFTAWTLTVPILALIAIILVPNPADRLGIASMAFVLTLFIILAVLASTEAPLGKGIATYRDYRAGYVECCEGPYEPEHGELSGIATKLGLRACFNFNDKLNKIRGNPDHPHTLERLPVSQRLWTLNGDTITHWIEVPWEGITQVREAKKQEIEATGYGGDTGCFLMLVPIFVTIVLYNILDFSLWYAPFLLVSLYTVQFKLLAFVEQRSRRQ